MKIEEYKDRAGEHRIHVKANNGNLVYASSEGYKNLSDAKETAIKSSIFILKEYVDNLTESQQKEISYIYQRIKDNNINQ